MPGVASAGEGGEGRGHGRGFEWTRSERMNTLIGMEPMQKCVADAVDSRKNLTRFGLMYKNRMIEKVMLAISDPLMYLGLT
jgi:hypothetical protein